MVATFESKHTTTHFRGKMDWDCDFLSLISGAGQDQRQNLTFSVEITSNPEVIRVPTRGSLTSV
eukprot:2436566-Rhodomonas_salina.1